MENLPCDTTSGTLKCEGCSKGCQLYNSLPRIGIANERTHWKLPESTVEKLLKTGRGNTTDIIVYRSHDSALYASARTNGQWAPIEITTIPNDDSNINAGSLPNNRIYLLTNPTPHSVRDPLTIAISEDGLAFDKCFVIQTCHDLLPSSSCTARYKSNRNVGPSYPQGLTVVDPAPKNIQGFYVVSTNNKEDVVVTKVDFSKL